MKWFIVGLLATSTASFAKTYTYKCDSSLEVKVNTKFLSKELKSIDDFKIQTLGEYVSGSERFDKYKGDFEDSTENELVERALSEKYKIIEDNDTLAYSSGFFELKTEAYVISIDRPSVWCGAFGLPCATYYKIEKCKK
ncbi:MAG: hypothetical protein ACOYL6_08025 [Bacteriovoracaceae bacterium]